MTCRCLPSLISKHAILGASVFTTHKCMWRLPGLFGPNTVILYAQQAVLEDDKKKKNPGSDGKRELGGRQMLK